MNDVGLSSSGFDLRDQINPATDASAAFALFSHSIDTAAMTYGVWGASNQTPDPGNPFSTSTLGTSNPLTSLIEFGRRQLNLGTYLIGLASSAMSTPQILAPSVLTALLGVCFILGGVALIFLIPLLPFVRF
jgi:hypothetical protein